MATAEKTIEKKDRLFIVHNDFRHPIVTFSRLPVTEGGVLRHQATIEIPQEPPNSGRYTLKADAEEYEAQYATLHAMCRDKHSKIHLQEIDLDDPKSTVAPDWTDNAKAKRLSDQRAKDMASDPEMKRMLSLKDEALAEQSEVLSEKDEEIAQLKAKLAAAGKK